MPVTPGRETSSPSLRELEWLGWFLEDSIATQRSLAGRAFARKRGLPTTTVNRAFEKLNELFASRAASEDGADDGPKQEDIFVGNRLTDRGSEIAVLGLIIGSCLKLLESDIPAPQRRAILRRAYQQLAGDLRGADSVLRHNKRNKPSLQRHLSAGDANFDWLLPTRPDPEDVAEMIGLQDAYDEQYRRERHGEDSHD